MTECYGKGSSLSEGHTEVTIREALGLEGLGEVGVSLQVGDNCASRAIHAPRVSL